MNSKTEIDLWSLYDNVSNTFKDSVKDSVQNNVENNLENNSNINKKYIQNEKELFQDEDDKEKCMKCFIFDNFRIEDGYKWCNFCGENNGIYIDTSPEWRYYGSEDSKSSDPTRCGIPSNYLLYNMSCGTTISSKGNSQVVRRLRTMHKYVNSNYNDRALLSIFEGLNVIATNHNINPMIIEHAKKIYKDIRDIKISRGVNRDALIATCLMASLNINNVSRSQKEIAEIFNIKQCHITQGRKKLMELDSYIKNNLIYKINITNSTNFIPRYCSMLNIENKYMELMKLISKKVEKLPDISENTPPAIASGVIYLISHLCKLNISKRDISQTCKISEVTINKCFKKLLIFIDLLFSDEIKKTYNIKYVIKIK